MMKTVSAKINKVTGEGVLMIEAAIFTTSKQRAKVGSIVIIVNPTLTFGEYNFGDILKVSGIDEDACDGSIYAKTQKELSLIHLEEYLVLTPQNLDAAFLAATISTSKVADNEDDECEHFDEFAEYADEIPEICQDCGNAEGCYSDIDFDEDDDDEDELDEAVAASEVPTMGGAEQFLTEIGVLPMTQKFLRVKALNTLESCDKPIKFKGEEAIAEFVELEYGEILALIRREKDGKILSYGLAQCNPDDVFCLEIGKVIALYRAGGQGVPRELIQFATYKVA